MERFSKGLFASLAILAAVLLFPAASAAKTIKVTSTIGNAIAAAGPGDTIVVPPGTYHEGISWSRRTT